MLLFPSGLIFNSAAACCARPGCTRCGDGDAATLDVEKWARDFYFIYLDFSIAAAELLIDEALALGLYWCSSTCARRAGRVVDGRRVAGRARRLTREIKKHHGGLAWVSVRALFRYAATANALPIQAWEPQLYTDTAGRVGFLVTARTDLATHAFLRDVKDVHLRVLATMQYLCGFFEGVMAGVPQVPPGAGVMVHRASFHTKHQRFAVSPVGAYAMLDPVDDYEDAVALAVGEVDLLLASHERLDGAVDGMLRAYTTSCIDNPFYAAHVVAYIQAAVAPPCPVNIYTRTLADINPQPPCKRPRTSSSI